MSFINKAAAIACAGSIFAATGAFAQAGGADVPTNAKAAGTMENGSSSTGMSKGKAMAHMKKKKHMKSHSM